MFGGHDQPAPPPSAAIQTTSSSAGVPPESPTTTNQAGAKAAGAGQLPSVDQPGVLTDTTDTSKKPANSSLIGET